jgi:hypothetical protein
MRMTETAHGHHKNEDHGNDDGRGKLETVKIQIDRGHYDVPRKTLQGAELRQVPDPDVPPDRDLFEVRPGAEDVLVADDHAVEMRPGLRFFTAPGRINPGSV